MFYYDHNRNEYLPSSPTKCEILVEGEWGEYTARGKCNETSSCIFPSRTNRRG
jgi:hypothetical protein